MPEALTADEIVTQGHVRIFMQFGGPKPGNRLLYYGVDWQYAFVSGTSLSYGSLDPINVPAPRVQKAYRLVGRSRSAPDLPTASLMLLQKHGIVPRELGRDNCNFNLYLVVGNCKDLSDPLNGWTDYVHTLSRAVPTALDFGDEMAMDSDDPVSDTYELTLADTYRVGRIGFGEQAAALITREVIDGVYGGGVQCGDCGPQDDGTRRLYLITAASGAGSPGLPAELVYLERLPDGSVLQTEYAITGLPAATSPTAIDVMGQYLIVLSSSESAYYYATIDDITGAPGAFTKVTGAFASGAPNDLYVASASKAIVVGNSGAIYQISSPISGATLLTNSATAQNLVRVDGSGATIVAVGAAGSVVLSVDNGATWAATVASPSALGLQAIAVKDRYHFWVGGAAGGVWYTLDGGRRWTLQAISDAAAINDIVFATDEVGYIAYQRANATAGIRATFCGGELWADAANANSRVGPLPAIAKINRLAIPRTVVTVTTANLAVAGQTSNVANSDGILLVGATPYL